MPDFAAREQAKKLIKKLATEKGWISEEDRQYLSIDRPWILESLDGIRRIACSTTKALSDNLYQKDTRFVYELIQNAEDSSHDIAKKEGKPPELRFTLSKDKIVIHSNEDGFSAANVSAICSVGESTKTSIRGYIGEKGIGFKSVFKVARRVHVQSEPYSFAFEYDYDLPDSGLGMVTPLPEEYFQLPDGIRTSMVLSLRADCNRDNLFHEFKNLPATFLLFLEKLKKLSFRIEQPGGGTVENVYTRSTENNRATITKAVGGVEENFYFWIKEKTVESMPEDDKRTIKKDGKIVMRITKADVILALPLDKEDVPIVDPQPVFAFLPMRKVGFKFLIQSDFITQADRRDIFDTPWNRRIFSEIVKLFKSLVRGLWDHTTLRYQWVRYLTVDSIPDDFWGELQRDLINHLKAKKLFASCREQRLFMGKARIVPTWLRDDDGNPLLPDCDCAECGNGTYLSESYDWDLDVPVLKKLGVQELASEEFVHKLNVDLNKDYALMWSNLVDDNWHTQIAEVLLKMISSKKNRESLADQISLLPLIPLIDKRPAPTKGVSIFLPTCGGIDIPRDLPLGLVQPESLRNEARAKLFDRLGVKECGAEQVIGLIEDASKMTGEKSISLEESVEHIKFLFWHHNKIFIPKPTIHVFDVHSQKFDPNLTSNGWTYSPLQVDKYHLCQILDPENKPYELQGKVRFLNGAYYKALSGQHKRHDTDPWHWLNDFFNVRYTAELSKRGHFSNPSPELEWLVKYRPEFLLGTLREKWDQFLLKSNAWKDKYSKCLVPIINSQLNMPLDESYLPIPELMEIVSGLGLERNFGFVSELREESDWSKWKEFRHLGVGTEEDLAFWIRILKKAELTAAMDATKMAEIYGNLQRMCRTDDDMAQIRDTFSATGSYYVFIPGASYDTSIEWFSIKKCLWNGPSWYSCRPLVSKTPEYASLYYLFYTVLGLENAGLDHYLDDLASLKESEGPLFHGVDVAEVIRNLYTEIYILAVTRNDIRSHFQNGNLVYDSKRKTWFSPKDCIWAKESIQIPGKFSVQDQYESLKSFFTGVLKVEAPSLKLHVEGLKETASSSPTFSDIKQRIRNICQLGPDEEDLKDLLDCNCLPVNCTDGSLAWLSSEYDFAIADRREYLELFRDEIDILDFSLEEVHEFKSFLMGLGLEHQYLSELVVSKTSAEGGEKNEGLTADLRKKAYAICRFAAHYESSTFDDIEETFRRLRTLDVIGTDSIRRELTVSQNEEDVTVEAERAYCHIKEVEDENSIRIYVPERRKSLDICLATYLPLALLEYLGVQVTEVGGFPSIISAKSLAVVDAILDTAGIINLVGVERTEDDDDDEVSEADDDDDEEVSEADDDDDEEVSEVDDNDDDEMSEADDDEQSAPRVEPDAPPSQRSRSPLSFLPTPATSISGSLAPQGQRELYKKLLVAVVDAAKNLAAVPQCGLTRSTTGFPSSLSPSDVDSAVRGSDRTDQIGAAGELFVFEWLKSLNLPNLDLSNWKSKIRGRVNDHPSFQGLQNWQGRESSDVVYDDTGSVLTRLLIDHGYLSPAWYGKRPKYYIEVKATTSIWSTRFFVTQNQVNLMEGKILPEQGAADEVYLIARVFSLGLNGMGLKLYVDPAKLRRKGQLIVRPDQYEVMPSFFFVGT